MFRRTRPARPALARGFLAAAALALVLAPIDARAGFRDLCTSVVGACEYTGPAAPKLGLNVCHGPEGTRLMDEQCPSGTWPYFVKYGEIVDPLSNEVVAYIPLDDACAHPGLCVEGPPPADAQEYPMCCTGNASSQDQTCVSGASCGGTVWYCLDGVCNEDGTVTCFHAEEI